MISASLISFKKKVNTKFKKQSNVMIKKKVHNTELHKNSFIMNPFVHQH